MHKVLNMVIGLSGRTFSIAVVSVILLTGCSGSDHVDGRYAVRGTVTLDGEPLATGNITFSPTDPRGRGTGSVITDGQYDIPAAKGLAEGDYRVAISSTGEKKVDDGEARARMLSQPGGSGTPKEIIPAMYNTQSKEKITVQEGERNIFDFDVKEEQDSFL